MQQTPRIPKDKPMADRHALHASISDRAYDNWQTFITDQGISVAAALEAIGRRLPEGRLELDEIVAAARRIDADRRRRRPST
jgi:hypothetical protein